MSALQHQVEEFIRQSVAIPIDQQGSEQDSRFQSLALELFRFQHERCQPYRRLCDLRGCDVTAVDGIEKIPALPSDAFKRPLFPPAPTPAHVFLSSGTSAGNEQRSRHELSSTSTYRLSALTHFRSMVLGDDPGPMSTLILGPTAATHPQSSLGHMYSWCAQEFGDHALVSVFDPQGQLDVEAALSYLADAAASKRPVLILAISSALTMLLDEMRRQDCCLRLPAESRIVDTGGPKGAKVLSAKGLLKAVWKRLHVPAYACINEYGMTEMLSQFYDDAWLSRYRGDLAPRSKVGPPWCQTRVVDPTTLQPVADGETGLLQHFDLANWESVSCLLTLDLGRRVGRGFQILGRAPAAQARGCSNLLIKINDGASSQGTNREQL